MATYTARVTVLLSAGVNDPQGNTVRSGLRALGFDGVESVRVGKVVDLVLDAPSEDEARRQLEAMCRQLLANPVIETFSIELAEAR